MTISAAWLRTRLEIDESSPRGRVGGLSGSVHANASLMDLRGERTYNAALVVVGDW